MKNGFSNQQKISYPSQWSSLRAEAGRPHLASENSRSCSKASSASFWSAASRSFASVPAAPSFEGRSMGALDAAPWVPLGRCFLGRSLPALFLFTLLEGVALVLRLHGEAPFRFLGARFSGQTRLISSCALFMHWRTMFGGAPSPRRSIRPRRGFRLSCSALLISSSGAFFFSFRNLCNACLSFLKGHLWPWTGTMQTVQMWGLRCTLAFISRSFLFPPLCQREEYYYLRRHAQAEW